MADAPRYHRWIVGGFRPYIRSPVIEVGCGQGTITELLLQCGAVTATDIDDEYLKAVRDKLPERGDLSLARLDLRDTAAWDGAGFATAVSVNVLEHIEDDAAALAGIHRMLAPGGYLAIQVPAMPALFGAIDVNLGHFRRYTKAELASKLGQAGFVVKEVYYRNLLGVAGWFVNTRLLKREMVSGSQVRLFDGLVPMLAFLERFLPPPFGLAVVAVAQKPS